MKARTVSEGSRLKVPTAPYDGQGAAMVPVEEAGNLDFFV
jgi:hypothetical protein